MKLALLMQIATMMTDLIIVAALVVVFRYNVGVGFLFLGLTHWTQKDTGGWFFSWRPANIRKFFENWKKMT